MKPEVPLIMLKILVADKYNIHRIGFVQILVEAFPDALIDEVNDAESLLKKIRAHEWDLLISGFILPTENGIDIIEMVKRNAPGIAVAICGLETETEKINPLLNAGACEYIDKGAKA